MRTQSENNASIIKILEQNIHCFEVERSIYQAVLPIAESWGSKQINKRLATAIDVELLKVFGKIEGLDSSDKPYGYPKCTAHVDKKQWGNGFELKCFWGGRDRYIAYDDGWTAHESPYSRTIDASIYFDDQPELVKNLNARIDSLKVSSEKKASLIANFGEVQKIISQIRVLHKQAEELAGYDLKLIEDFTRD